MYILVFNIYIMSIKDHHLYPLYIEYLKRKRLTKGARELSKLSEEFFFEFKTKYDLNENFREKQDRAHKSTSRETKLDILLKDTSGI